MTARMSIYRYLGPRSPLGPGVAGVLSTILFVLVSLTVGPIVVKAVVWWWSLWLP